MILLHFQKNELAPQTGIACNTGRGGNLGSFVVSGLGWRLVTGRGDLRFVGFVFRVDTGVQKKWSYRAIWGSILRPAGLHYNLGDCVVLRLQGLSDLNIFLLRVCPDGLAFARSRNLLLRFARVGNPFWFAVSSWCFVIASSLCLCQRRMPTL